MEEGETTDEDVWENAAGARPATSSSDLASSMSLEEQQVLRRLREKFKNSSGIKPVEVLKSFDGKETVIACTVNVSREDPEVKLMIVHRDSCFSVQAKNADWLIDPLAVYCANACTSLTRLLLKVTEIVEQRRLALFMDALHVEPLGPSDNILEQSEESSSDPSLSSGTTAASPQSSRSTTTSRDAT